MKKKLFRLLFVVLIFGFGFSVFLLQKTYATSTNAEYTKYINISLQKKLNKSMKNFIKKLDKKFPNEKDKIQYLKRLKKLLIFVSKKRQGMVKYVMQYIASIL